MFLLDGRKVRDSLVPKLRSEVRDLGFSPTLAIVEVGESERTRTYVSEKRKFAETIGAEVSVFAFPHDMPHFELLEKLEELNKDPSIHGIIVQLPLPRDLDFSRLVDAIDPRKDVDGLTAANLKLLLYQRRGGFIPATAKGVITLLDYYKIPLGWQKVAVVGRSFLVGKPLSLALIARDATVTVCHSKTAGLPEVTRQADILVVATGKPKLIGREHVKAGQIVVDVGINVEQVEHAEEGKSAKRLVGDVDFEAVKNIVGAITPVPGGVGPMTVASLFENLVEAARKQVSQYYSR